MRDEDALFRASFRGGIFEDSDFADPTIHVADARDLWSPRGEVEIRPRYWQVGYAFRETHTLSTAAVTYVSENGVGSFTSHAPGVVALGGFPSTDFGRLYFPFSPLSYQAISFEVTTANTNPVEHDWEYYSSDGKWKPLAVVQLNEGAREDLLFGSIGAEYTIFPATPVDMTSVSVSGLSVALRLTITSSGAGSRLSAGTALDTTLTSRRLQHATAKYKHIVGAKTVRLQSNSEQFYYAYVDENESALEIMRSRDVGVRYDIDAKHAKDLTVSEPMTAAAVPQFEEVFFAYNGRCYEWSELNKNSTFFIGGSTVALESSARVETRDFAVGPDAPYDPALVPQLSDFPGARYILYANGRLWVIEGDNTLRWSAASPYHRVWPAQAAEVVGNRRATGLALMGEQVVVFNDSEIYIAVPNGTSANGVASFTPRRVVVGVGSVSNAGISEFTKGKLAFPGQDGLYVFDGSPEPRKVTEHRLDSFWSKLTDGTLSFASAVHWRKYHCYLLAVEVNGEATTKNLPGDGTIVDGYNNQFVRRNTHVVVWDYQTDALWLWRIPVNHWICDNDTLHFVDAFGRIHCMDVASTSFDVFGREAIVSGGLNDTTFDHPFLLSHELAHDEMTKTARHVYVRCSNTTDEVEITLTKNDESQYEGAVGSFSASHPSEPKWSGGVTWTAATAALRKWAQLREVQRRVDIRKTGEYFRLLLRFTAGPDGKRPILASLKRVMLAEHVEGRR